MSWASGYVSAWQEIKVYAAERNGDEDLTAAIKVRPAQGQRFMALVEAACQRSPDDQFVDAISNTYWKWNDR
jgi:hypothetical protein